MATLYVTEFTDVGVINGHITYPAQSPTAEQTIAIGGSSTASSAFNARTAVVGLHTDAICSVSFGTAPTATAVKARLAANETRYFAVPVGQSYKVAVITNT